MDPASRLPDVPDPRTLREQIRAEIRRELEEHAAAVVAAAERRAEQILRAAYLRAAVIGEAAGGGDPAERAKILEWFGPRILDAGRHLPPQPLTRLTVCDSRDPRRHVRLSAAGDRLLHLETPGLRFLAGIAEPAPPSPSDEKRLRAAGWRDPAEKAGRTYWWADMDRHADIDDLAYMIGVVFCEIHRVSESADLEYVAVPLVDGLQIRCVN